MRFRIEQRFGADADTVCEALTNADYLVNAMGELPDIGAPSVREQRRDGDRVRQLLRFQFQGRLPGPVTRVIDPSRLSWIEDTTVDLSARTATFRMTPEHYATFFTCSGRWAVHDDGAALHLQCQRVIDGELKVSSPVPFVGGQVEKAIVSGLRERLGHEPAVLARWLARRSGRPAD